jgi:hypothetical protein
MDIPILLEALPADGYRATSLSPTRLSATAPSREEALEQVSRLVREHLADAEVVHLQVALPDWVGRVSAGAVSSLTRCSAVWPNSTRPSPSPIAWSAALVGYGCYPNTVR